MMKPEDDKMQQARESNVINLQLPHEKEGEQYKEMASDQNSNIMTFISVEISG